jgi:hypothetical protein
MHEPTLMTIVPSYALSPNSKRSVDEHNILERGASWDNSPLAIGDTPWYCFWNATINEFWIFVDETANASSTLTSSDYSPTTSSSSSSATNSFAGQRVSMTSDKTTWDPTYTDYRESYTAAVQSAQATTWPTPALNKRSYTSAYYPTYPKLIKMVEKRKPSGNVPPYCQRMQVLADWQIVPREDNELIFINELEYATSPISSRVKKRDTTNELESNCVCEWLST